MAKKRAKKEIGNPQPEQEAPNGERPEKEPANKKAVDPQPEHVAPGHKGPDKTLRDRQAARIGRTIKVLRLIQGRGRWNAQALADELGCHVRTIARDLDALEYAGVLWHFDKVYQCYRIRNEYCLPTPGLTEEEATGKKFTLDMNQRWLESTRPIVEAFLHARYFLEMTIKYGKELKEPPMHLRPHGWAAALGLFGLEY